VGSSPDSAHLEKQIELAASSPEVGAYLETEQGRDYNEFQNTKKRKDVLERHAEAALERTVGDASRGNVRDEAVTKRQGRRLSAKGADAVSEHAWTILEKALPSLATKHCDNFRASLTEVALKVVQPPQRDAKLLRELVDGLGKAEASYLQNRNRPWKDLTQDELHIRDWSSLILVDTKRGQSRIRHRNTSRASDTT
jgi:hypothetical protein